ncbi:MAG: FtsW/RodA/SpoVE family cell cycle protein [Lachnospiraceae bacterium]|nr:FtsW/RodA/SpoVE family cell cycle protein [Lachnospiraceae bacterium]
MEQYITEFSKYFIAIFMALYTYECFAVFRYSTEEKRKGIYFRQNILMFLVHFTCFLTICVETGELDYLFFYAFQEIILFAAISLFGMIYPRINKLLINNICLLLSIGFVILTRLSYERAIKQFIIVTVSLIIAMIIPFFMDKFKFLKDLKWMYAIVGIAALSAVLILGSVTKGAKLSFSVGGVSFQPSEFIKIIFVFFVASALYKASGFVQVVITAVIAGIHVIVLVLSKDLGSALIFFVVYVLMVVVATKNWLYLFAGAAGGSAAAIIAYKLFYHVQVRVLAWQDPWSVIDNEGYQIAQSLFAIGSGGWFGLGLYKGTPDSIPDVEADFIFSAVAEELGLIVAMCLILVCVSCFIMCMNIAVRLQDKFYQLVAFGLGTTYIFQVFLTIGGGTKFIPLTGVTLPFISYGGSSVLTTLILFSIIEGLYIIKQREVSKSVKTKRKTTTGRNSDRRAGIYEDSRQREYSFSEEYDIEE